MKHFTFLILNSFLLFSFHSVAQYKIKKIEANNIRASVMSNGMLFHDTAYNLFFNVPKNSGNNTIGMSGLWLGAENTQGDLFISTQEYYYSNQISDFSYGPLIDPLPSDYEEKYDKVWRITRGEVEEFIENETLTDAITTWPANPPATAANRGYWAPYVDVNDDGVYQPSDGDYPDFPGDEALYFIMNDSRNKNVSGTASMGIEVHGMLYAYKNRGDALNNSVFLRYNITNTSQQNYENVRLGLITDFDLGYPFDDFIGSYKEGNSYFAYNGDDVDEDNFGDKPPAQLVSFLNHSMDGYIYYDNDFSKAGNPQTPEEFYNYLSSRWRDGSALTDSGRGLEGGNVTKYAYPGDPESLQGWSEEESGNSAFDRRGLGWHGPFKLRANEQLVFDFAFIYALGSNRLNSVTRAKERADSIRESYRDNTLSLYNNAGQFELSVYPNPTKNELNIAGKQKTNLQLKLFDVHSRELSSYHLEGKKEYQIDVSNLKPGIYFIRLKRNGETQTVKFLKQ